MAHLLWAPPTPTIADLRGTADLVPNHRNKVNSTIESLKLFYFPMRIKVMFMLYYSLSSVQLFYV